MVLSTKLAVISDVHSNLEALKAVLADIKKTGIKQILFTGDAIGYGPDPDECLRIIEAESNVMIAGNHDWASIGLTDIAFFNSAAQNAIKWTMGRLTKENIELLKRLKLTEPLSEINVFLVHSTPKEPQRWSYLLTGGNAVANFEYFDEQICFLGHSHIPFIAERNPQGDVIVYKDKIKVSEGSRYIVNAGSVGQPRDSDPRACYCIYDKGTIYFRRVKYDVSLTQNKMIQNGLPAHLIHRLSYGV